MNQQNKAIAHAALSPNILRQHYYKPPCWPPPDDFPVSFDKDGQAISIYSDARWNLTPLTEKTLSIYFGDGISSKSDALMQENANILRRFAASLLWGRRSNESMLTLVSNFELLKKFVRACDNNGIVASEISKKRMLFADIAKLCSGRRATRLERLFALMLSIEDELGFVIFNNYEIKLFGSLLEDEGSMQTPYIPPRIWSFQIERLESCLRDFDESRDKLKECYEFCIQAYIDKSAGVGSSVFENEYGTPFSPVRAINNKLGGDLNYGRFTDVLHRFGVYELVNSIRDESQSTPHIRGLTSYLNFMTNVGLLYVLNFSLMRSAEAETLRVGCLSLDKDEFGNEAFIITAATSKTIKDKKAKWIVPKNIKLAIDVLEFIALLRAPIARENPYVRSDDIESPLLNVIPGEPWLLNYRSCNPLKKLAKLRTYKELVERNPKIFTKSILRITDEDYAIASKLTENLDPERFGVGLVWPLAKHQLRRTGAVNMLASGLVSPGSLQYQLKHANRAMSLYYGRHNHRLSMQLNTTAREFYLSELFNSIGRELKGLSNDQHISPHGATRKAMILEPISNKEHKELVAAAKAGDVVYRQTFLGGCTKRGEPCPYGGFNNISECMGFGNGKPCAEVLLDVKKLPIMMKIKDLLSKKILTAEKSTPLLNSLSAQLESVERAINVIKRR